MLVLGVLVIAGAGCFIALGSRRMRLTAGAVVVLAAAGGLMVGLFADSPSFTALENEFDCNKHGAPWCLEGYEQSSARLLGGLGAVLAGSYGIVALLRSREPFPTPATYKPRGSSGDTPSGDFAPRHERRISDASLLALTMVALVIAFVVGLFAFVQALCSEPTEWC